MKKIIFYLILLFFFAIMFSLFHEAFLNLKALEISEFSKTLSKNQIDKIITFSGSKEYLNYIVVPINIFAKVFSIAIILFIGCILFETKVKFKDLLLITIKAEFVFLLPIIYEIIYFKFFQPTHSYSDIQNFSSLSIFNLLKEHKLDSWFIYPLQVLNLFELAYWLILSYYIGKIASPTKNGVISKYPIDFGLKIVATSYGSALLLWVVVVMFFTLNYS